MPICYYCQDKFLYTQTFSGLKGSYCQSCWHKIYHVYTALEMIKDEPALKQFAEKIIVNEQ